jgi:hypothetical protein
MSRERGHSSCYHLASSRGASAGTFGALLCSRRVDGLSVVIKSSKAVSVWMLSISVLYILDGLRCCLTHFPRYITSAETSKRLVIIHLYCTCPSVAVDQGVPRSCARCLSCWTMLNDVAAVSLQETF